MIHVQYITSRAAELKNVTATKLLVNSLFNFSDNSLSNNPRCDNKFIGFKKMFKNSSSEDVQRNILSVAKLV